MKKIFTFLLFVLTINTLNAQCSANFTYTLNSAGNVTFSNTSTYTGTNVTYFWNFGDTQTSTVTHPTHNYAGNGTYIVSLTINDSILNNSCTNTFTQNIVISNTACLVSSITNSVQGANGLVTFNEILTTNILPSTNYTINFGDNTIINLTGPFYSISHTYSASGLYTFSMNVSNSPTCASLTMGTIYVSVQSCSLAANFSSTLSAGNATFTNLSIGTSSSTSYFWDFNNNNYSNAQNPSPETYLYNGIYTVNLTISDSINFFCTSSLSKSIAIVNAPCYVNSAFTMAKDSTQIPMIVWNAYPNYPQNVVSVLWSWGDNSTSNSMYPSHTYSAAGNYSICLTVSVSCGSSTTTCFNALINKGGQLNQIATVHVINNATSLITKTKELLADFVIQPNPNNGTFEIKNLNKHYNAITVYNQLGQAVYTNSAMEKKEMEVILDLPNGIYYLQISNEAAKFTKKFILTK